MKQDNVKDRIGTLQILLDTIDKEMGLSRVEVTHRSYKYVKALKELKSTAKRLINMELDTLNRVRNKHRKNRLRRKMSRQLDECEDARQLVKYLSLK